MPLVNIPSVGQVNFPDSMSPDEVNQAAGELYDKANQPAAKAAAESTLPIPAEMPDVVQMGEAIKKNFPSPYEKEQELKSMADRNQQSFLSGILNASLPVSLVQAAKQNEEQALAPLNQEAKRQGLPPLQGLVAEGISKLPTKLGEALNFAPQNLSETAVQFAGGALAPSNVGIKETFPKYRQGFEPLETAIVPKDVAKNFDSPAVQGALKDELKGLLESQAKYETQAIARAEKYAAKVSPILDKEISLKETAASKVDRLSRQAAEATSKKETTLQNLKDKLSTFDDSIEDPTVFNDRVSSLESKKVGALEKIRALDQEVMGLQQSTSPVKVSRLQGQRLAQQQVLQDIAGDIADVEVSRGLSRDQRLIYRTQLQSSAEGLAAQANLAEKVTLNQLSSKAITVGEELLTDRTKLLKQIQTARQLKSGKLEELTEKLRDNLVKQEQMKQAVVDNKVVVHSKVDWDRMFGSTSTPEIIHAEALARAKQVDLLVEQGIVPADKAGQLRVAIYQETLGANGIKPVSEKMSKVDIIGELFRYGQIQKKTGVPVGDTTQNFVFAFTKASNSMAEQKGIISEILAPLKNKDSVVSDLQYFRTQADGTIAFDPSALYIPGKVNIPATLKQFTPEEAQVLSQFRSFFDATADRLGIPKIPGYIPIRELSSDVVKSSTDSTLNPALLRARTSGEFIPGLHETDVYNLMNRYLSEVNKAEYIAPALDEGIATLNQLRLSGLTNEAEAFKKYMIDMFHLDGEKEVAQLFGAHLLKANREDIAAFVKLLPDPDSAMKQISDAGTRALYVNLVGTNPNSIVKQYMQGPMMGSIELGPSWAASGVRDGSNVFTKAGRDRIAHAKTLLKASLADNFQQLDDQFTNAPTNQIAKAIDFINKPGAFVAKHTMGAGEMKNRVDNILGSENKWNFYWQNGGPASIQKLLSQSALTTAQRSLISKAFIAGGMENARDIYALLITQRVNATYSMADKPELMRSVLGQMFPFTTYTRNILARAAEAIAEGKPMVLAKQVLVPLSYMVGFTAITGYNLPKGSHPWSGFVDLIERGMTPGPLIIAKDLLGTVTPMPKNSLKEIMTGTFDPRKKLAEIKEKKFPFTKNKGELFP